MNCNELREDIQDKVVPCYFCGKIPDVWFDFSQHTMSLCQEDSDWYTDTRAVLTTDIYCADCGLHVRKSAVTEEYFIDNECPKDCYELYIPSTDRAVHMWNSFMIKRI